MDRRSTPDIPLSTSSGIPLKEYYSPADTDDAVTAPGQFPFTRGIRPTMYRDSLWVMGQYSGYATPRETNLRIKELIGQGQKGFSVALDLPTQNGLDSDDPLAAGEVGKVGVPINSLSDVIDLLEGIDLSQVSQIRTTANSIGPVIASFLIEAIERLGGSPEDIRVMFQNDVLKEYVARGTQIFPPRRGLSFSVDLIEYCSKHLKTWEPIEFCGYHIRDSGSTAVQEVAFAIANGREYIDECLRRGVAIDEFAPNIYMFLSADIDILEEVAKFRASRRIWAHLIRDHYGSDNPASQALNIFVYTLGGSLTAQEPLNNLSRVSFQALAAVLGGVQTLATSSYDEAVGLPTAEAAHLSLRAQQLIAFETGVARTADPLGGSYVVEWLTDELERQITEYLAAIEHQGGALSALESGWMRSEIEAAAYAQQRALESGDRPRIGVNLHRTERPPIAGSFAVSRTAEAEQISRLETLRKRRDSALVERALDRLREAASNGDNTMEPIMAAVKRDATIGEIIAVLRSEWGSYRNG